MCNQGIKDREAPASQVALTVEEKRRLLIATFGKVQLLQPQQFISYLSFLDALTERQVGQEQGQSFQGST